METSASFEPENLKKDHSPKKHYSKNDGEGEDDFVFTDDDDFNKVDKEDDYVEPAGPKKGEIRNTDIIIDDDDDDDEF